jgi:hypothetical protein
METLQRDPVKIDLILGRPAEANVEDRRWGQLRLAESDLNAALIDRDQRLDLPTFAASEAQIEAINAAVIDCRGNWPPPKSDRMQKASFTGFPEIIRAVHPDRSADFNPYGGLEVVEAVTDREIIFTYDPERVQPLNAPKPPLGSI